jgi:predicted CoA-substrate-specific enzyme activase
MRSLGIDVGSRTVKIALIDNGRFIHTNIVRNNHEPENLLDYLLKHVVYDTITVTGYGRHQFCERIKANVISEIKAFAIGCRSVFPTCRTILEIGGQDTKVIALAENGAVRKFEMNDKCAAGTGRFLEIMADALGFCLEEFGKAAIEVERYEKINSMCTVFAESEAISLLAKGASKKEIALGIHYSIAERSYSMLKRIPLENDIVFAGGVALNPAMQKLVAAFLQKTILIPENPQILGALGSAIYGKDF